MKHRLFLLTIFVLVASLLLGACATPAATTEAPMETKEVTAVVGFTASQTGNYQTESTRQTNGLQLWMKQVNEAGGVKLSDGTVVKFEAKFYDDESTKEKVQELYTRLATEDDATFLISPYSSRPAAWLGQRDRRRSVHRRLFGPDQGQGSDRIVV